MAGKGQDRVTPRICRVVSGYTSAYPEPFLVQPGEALTASDRQSEWSGWVWCTNHHGESRWLPEAYLQRQGQTCTALRTYDATELTVHPGEELVATEEQSGWIWCTDQGGHSGWVPANHLMDETPNATSS